MIDLIQNYWPHILAVISVVVGAVASAHAALTKEDARAASGWVGVIVLSPLIGAFIYLVAGINRIRHTALATRRSGRRTFDKQSHEYSLSPNRIVAEFGRPYGALNRLGDALTRFYMTSGNSIQIIEDGDQAYRQMCDAIDGARATILLESYIFDNDEIGRRVADRLLAAKARGVTVRVLIDAVGARYSMPSIVRYFRERGLHARSFNGNVIMGLRLPYANLRTHRKIIVIDGDVAFTGGMNIRKAFTEEFAGDKAAHDTHFRVTGPVVRDLFAIAAEDWHFATAEKLDPIAHTPSPDAASTYIRVVSSGPDVSIETNRNMLIGALSVAQQSVRIMSPYFLPDRELVSALATASRRGVRIDIVVPNENNLRLVDLAMMAQFDQVVKNGCHVWRVEGMFNHSKLMVIDSVWSYVGTSNMDPRSLRLNFEVDLEVLDRAFAAVIGSKIDKAIAHGRQLSLHDIRDRALPIRLVEKLVWLASPYL
jgi:cardiolipin synthase